MEATAKLVESLGGTVVKMVFLIELCGLHGRDKLAKYDVDSVVKYEGK
jgi:adenine phosphoribosyltransferase